MDVIVLVCSITKKLIISLDSMDLNRLVIILGKRKNNLEKTTFIRENTPNILNLSDYDLKNI